MSMDIRFCALESVERSESILGTATEASCYLLVECDDVWPAEVGGILLNAGLPEELGRALQAFVDWCPQTVHPLLVKQPGRSGPRRIYVVRADLSKGKCLLFEDVQEDPLAALQDAYFRPERIDDIALVCTHGKRDKCCAKLGVPVYAELQQRLGGRFEVFQCSHVGGDRFAANVFWLPHGVCLGHVHTDVAGTIGKLKEGLIPLPHLRGTASLPSAAQYLEGHWRKELNLERPGMFELQDFEERDLGERQVSAITLRIPSMQRAVQGFVSIHRSSSTVLASCNRNGAGHPRIFQLVSEREFLECALK
jgi:hypothetical protein